MTNMQKFAAQQLTKKEMKEVSGGVSVKEYCATLLAIICDDYAKTWSDEEWNNATTAWEKHCI